MVALTFITHQATRLHMPRMNREILLAYPKKPYPPCLRTIKTTYGLAPIAAVLIFTRLWQINFNYSRKSHLLTVLAIMMLNLFIAITGTIYGLGQMAAD